MQAEGCFEMLLRMELLGVYIQDSRVLPSHEGWLFKPQAGTPLHATKWFIKHFHSLNIKNPSFPSKIPSSRSGPAIELIVTAVNRLTGPQTKRYSISTNTKHLSLQFRFSMRK